MTADEIKAARALCKPSGLPMAKANKVLVDTRSALIKALDEAERLRGTLTTISAIRDSIVGKQGFNFSEHAYPLVAALDAAGFEGAGYEIARASLGTLIEQRDRAEAERDALRAEVASLNEYLDVAKSVSGRNITLSEQLAVALAEVERMRPTFEASLEIRRNDSPEAIVKWRAAVDAAIAKETNK